MIETNILKLKKKLSQILSTLFPKENIRESKDKWNSLAAEDAQFHVLTKGKGSFDLSAFRNEGEIDIKRYVLEDEFIRERLPNFTSCKVLEIGCGIGRLSEFLAKNFGFVSAIDISEEMINKAKARLKEVNNLEFFATNGEHYPFQNDTFDFVFSFIVFQHMPSEEVIRNNFMEISRVLKKGGVAKVQVRGTPIRKDSPYYGPHFDENAIKKLINGININIAKTEGEGQKYFWIYLIK